MTPAYAAEIVSWHYPPPYDFYDMTCDAAFVTDPVNGYWALVDEDALIGFRSFGADGQVPGGDYDGSALDTGGGLRPDLTGRGLGGTAITAGLAFGREQFAPAAFRMTVATFNLRAQRVVTALGFRNVETFPAARDGRSFEIFIRAEPHPA